MAANTAWSTALFNPASAAFIPLCGPSGVAVTTQALNSAYTYGSAGTAVAVAFAAWGSTFTDFSTYIVSVNGTGGSLSWELRASAAGNGIPGTTIVDSGTISGSNTTGWKSVSGRTASLNPGELYWLIIFDSSTAGTNYSTLRLSNSLAVNSLATVIWTANHTTSNGFATAASGSGKGMYGAICIDGIWAGGEVHDTNAATTTSGTYERGMRFKLPVAMTLCGFADFVGDVGTAKNGEVFKLWDDSNNLLNTVFTMPTYTRTGTSPVDSAFVFPVSSWVNVAANTWYMFTITPPSATTVPRKLVLGASSPPAGVIAGCFILGGNCHYVENNGSWDKSQTTSYCSLGPIVCPGGATSKTFAAAG